MFSTYFSSQLNLQITLISLTSLIDTYLNSLRNLIEFSYQSIANASKLCPVVQTNNYINRDSILVLVLANFKLLILNYIKYLMCFTIITNQDITFHFTNLNLNQINIKFLLLLKKVNSLKYLLKIHRNINTFLKILIIAKQLNLIVIEKCKIIIEELTFREIPIALYACNSYMKKYNYFITNSNRKICIFS